MLAAQMAVIHTATMTFARRLANVETIEQQDSAERALNKLARTFAMQMEALKRYRTGGGGTERLPHLVGRGRALEIVLGASDFDGDTAERYGYVNRALPDAELDGFVDALARRIASFDRRAIAAAKNLVNRVSLPSADRLLDAITSFGTALTWPKTQQRIQVLLKRGLQLDGDFEKRWPALLGTLLET
jgi:hypothetical protein